MTLDPRYQYNDDHKTSHDSYLYLWACLVN